MLPESHRLEPVLVLETTSLDDVRFREAGPISLPEIDDEEHDRYLALVVERRVLCDPARHLPRIRLDLVFHLQLPWRDALFLNAEKVIRTQFRDIHCGVISPYRRCFERGAG